MNSTECHFQCSRHDTRSNALLAIAVAVEAATRIVVATCMGGPPRTSSAVVFDATEEHSLESLSRRLCASRRKNLWVPFLANAFDSEKAQQWHALVTWWRVRLASVRWRQESHWRVRVHQSRDVQDVTF